MIKVWVLVFYVSGYHAGGPATIENIISLTECQRIQKVISGIRNFHEDRSICIEVVKKGAI